MRTIIITMMFLGLSACATPGSTNSASSPDDHKYLKALGLVLKGTGEGMSAAGQRQVNCTSSTYGNQTYTSCR